MAGSSNGDKDSFSAMLLDLEALDCPICYHVLTAPIFQCDNGHIVCSTCCNKLRNKCSSCTLPIGHSRCRALERIIEGVIAPCPNVKLGCTKRFSYGKELSTHEKECVFSPCSCPMRNCDYTGSYMDLFTHFGIHKGESKRRHRYQFAGKFANVVLFANITFEFPEYTSVVMEEYKYGLLFVFQCFNEPNGVYVTVSCIAPCAREIGEFSCSISTLGKYNMRIELLKVKKIRKLMSSETPKEDFMLLPSYVLCGRQSLKLRLCVSKVA